MATLTTRVTHLEDCYDIIDGRLERIEHKIDNGLSERIATAVSGAIKQERAAEWDHEREERRLQIDEQRARNETMGKQKDRVNRILIAAIVPASVGLMKLVELLMGG